jgi:hypothetical protein
MTDTEQLKNVIVMMSGDIIKQPFTVLVGAVAIGFLLYKAFTNRSGVFVLVTVGKHSRVHHPDPHRRPAFDQKGQATRVGNRRVDRRGQRGIPVADGNPGLQPASQLLTQRFTTKRPEHLPARP